jgi:hypothetical protein
MIRFPLDQRPSRAIVAAIALLAMAPAFAQNADELGKSLTPVGGERAGNKSGTIPAWAPEKQDVGWAWGKLRLDHWKHKGDKPLFSIDATNVEQYADRLSPAQVAVVKQTKGFRMDVYPTRRSCNVPDFVAENTKKNVGFAKLAADGWALEDAVVPGIPFPMPSNGAQAMLNQMLRYRGVASEFKAGATMVSPRKGSADWINYGYEQTFYWPWGAKGSHKLSEIGKTRTHTSFSYRSPAALAGQAGVVTDYIDRPGAEVFWYFPGQRRVRRLPSYAYDAPQIGFENQYAMDEVQVFIGAIDRFDWKLAGKKELIVPYNVLGAYEFSGSSADIAQPDFVNPKNRRYELHRVWVVEATVKSGLRHLAPKRTYYLDEDSWNAVLAEDYDGQGKLWKLREGYLIPVFETGSCDVAAFAQYNLADGRYLFDFHAAGTGTDARWYVEPTGRRMDPGYYTSENLRAISER